MIGILALGAPWIGRFTVRASGARTGPSRRIGDVCPAIARVGTFPDIATLGATLWLRLDPWRWRSKFRTSWLLGRSRITVAWRMDCGMTEQINSHPVTDLKRGAYLINTARGKPCIAEDVAAALERGQLAGYAGDVWFPQPPPSSLSSNQTSSPWGGSASPISRAASRSSEA
jgi:hypothetical protein